MSGTSTTMPLSQLLQDYRPGSEDWSWEDEAEFLWESSKLRLELLMEDIHERGVLNPVLLGPDGRVWNGHHRLVALQQLAENGWIGFDYQVPVGYGAISKEQDHGLGANHIAVGPPAAGLPPTAVAVEREP